MTSTDWNIFSSLVKCLSYNFWKSCQDSGEQTKTIQALSVHTFIWYYLLTIFLCSFEYILQLLGLLFCLRYQKDDEKTQVHYPFTQSQSLHLQIKYPQSSQVNLAFVCYVRESLDMTGRNNDINNKLCCLPIFYQWLVIYYTL